VLRPNAPAPAPAADVPAPRPADAKSSATADRAAFKAFHAACGARSVRVLFGCTWSQGCRYLRALGYVGGAAHAILRAVGATDLEPARG
jgi:hypothetical protein